MQGRNRRKVRHLRAAVVAGIASCAIYSGPVMAQTGTWTNNASSTWSTTTNWSGGTVANGAGNTANFTLDINGDRTVTLDTNRTIGNLTFTDSTTASNNWILAASGGSVLTLDVTTAPAIINVTNQAATINAVLATADGDSVQKNGAGLLVLGAQNTIAGGFIQNAGTTRVGVDTTISAGAIISGAVGTGTLTLTGGTLQDNGSARTIRNNLLINGSVSLTSSGTGSLTFSSVGLTTPSQVTIGVANPTLTVTNTTTFANAVNSTNTFTKSGLGRLNLTADNSATWSAASVTSNGGVLGFSALNAAPTGSARPIVAGTGAVTHSGVALTQAFVDAVSLSSSGTVAIDANTANNIDFTGFTGGVRLGASGTFTYSGVHTPATAGQFRLGGGGGTLTYSPAITGVGTTVNIGGSATTNAGSVTLSNVANDFDGGITVDGGTLNIAVADGTPGSAAPLGLVPVAAATNITLLNGGTLRSTAVAGTIHANRGYSLGTGGGIIDTNGNAMSLPGAWAGANSSLIKDGIGTATLAASLPSGTGLTVRGGTTTAASILNLGGAALNTSGITIASNSTSASALPAELTNVGNVTASSTLNIGTDGPGRMAMASGATFTQTAGDFAVGRRVNGTISTGTGLVSTFDASAGGAFSFSGTNFIVGLGVGSSNGQPFTATATLPTAANASITASTALTVAGNNNNGATGNLTFAGGTNTVRTPTIVFGGQKSSATISMPAGGTLDIAGISGGRAAMTIAGNASVGTGTVSTVTANFSGGIMTAQLSSLVVGDRAGGPSSNNPGGSNGSLTLSNSTSNVLDVLNSAGNALVVARFNPNNPSGTVTAATNISSVTVGGGTVNLVSTAAASSAVVLGNYNGTNANNVANLVRGSLILNGGTVSIQSAGTNAAVNLAPMVSTISGANNRAEGILTIAGANVTVNNTIAHGGNGGGTGTSESTLNLSSGSLNMSGKDIGAITNLNFTGGTLRNVGTLNRSLSQSGVSALLEISANNTLITGDYNLTGGAATVAAGRTLTINGAGGATLSGGTLSGLGAVVATAVSNTGGNVAPGTSPGTLTVTGAYNQSGTGRLTIEIAGPTPGTGHDVLAVSGVANLTAGTVDVNLDTFAPSEGSVFNVLTASDINGAGNSLSGLTFDYTDAALAPGLTWDAAIVNVPGGEALQLTVVPEPATAGLALISASGLLLRRRKRR